MKVTVSYLKKMPIPGVPYSNVEASVSLELDREIDSPASEVAADLFSEATQAVAKQLDAQEAAVRASAPPASEAPGEVQAASEAPAQGYPGRWLTGIEELRSLTGTTLDEKDLFRHFGHFSPKDKPNEIRCPSWPTEGGFGAFVFMQEQKGKKWHEGTVHRLEDAVQGIKEGRALPVAIIGWEGEAPPNGRFVVKSRVWLKSPASASPPPGDGPSEPSGTLAPGFGPDDAPF